MEEEPLLTGSINRGSGDYGSHDNGQHYQHEESPGSRRQSYSRNDDSYREHEDADADLYIQQAVVFIEDAIQYRSINHRVDSGSLRNILDILFVLQAYLIGWDEFRMNKWLIGYIVVIAASVIDWMLSISMVCSESLRVRRLIRPFFLLQNSSLMKKTLKCIKRTLPEIASVILLLALHLCLFTMIGMLIFAKSDDPKKNGEWETYFKNLPKALSSLLVLLTTANNPDGTYLLMNLMTAIIYNQFRGYLLTSIIRRRLGIRAAFEVLCCPGRGHTSTQSEGHVERVAVNMFLQVMNRVHMKSYCRQAIIKAAQQFPDGFINGEAFQSLFNELDKDFMKEHPPKPEYSSRVLQQIQHVYSHFCITVLGNAVALVNVICICTVLVLNSEKSTSEKNYFYMEAIQIAIFITYRIPYKEVDPITQRWMTLWEMVRLVNMLIVFRFLRIIPEIKLMAVVASTLVDLVKNLRAFAGILLSSLILLYNIMVVNNWHVFTDAYTRYTTEWSLVYFVAWWLTSSVMWNFTYKWDRSNALSVQDVERIAYQSTVQLIFRYE
ncbi:Two pore calcium channel protein 2 [Labeo rohita]|uniref:Two pore calcium channel protein 2 n=1 Tax=Labeo rohita TaxID=84645 RepID=A0ABQ8MK62_LABRO|nr:Two pore calcium channel protein 2 [Labeo rohita]